MFDEPSDWHTCTRCGARYFRPMLLACTALPIENGYGTACSLVRDDA